MKEEYGSFYVLAESQCKASSPKPELMSFWLEVIDHRKVPKLTWLTKIYALERESIDNTCESNTSTFLFYEINFLYVFKAIFSTTGSSLYNFVFLSSVLEGML